MGPDCLSALSAVKQEWPTCYRRRRSVQKPCSEIERGHKVLILLKSEMPSHGRGRRFNPYSAHHFTCVSRSRSGTTRQNTTRTGRLNVEKSLNSVRGVFVSQLRRNTQGSHEKESVQQRRMLGRIRTHEDSLNYGSWNAWKHSRKP